MNSRKLEDELGTDAPKRCLLPISVSTTAVPIVRTSVPPTNTTPVVVLRSVPALSTTMSGSANGKTGVSTYKIAAVTSQPFKIASSGAVIRPVLPSTAIVRPIVFQPSSVKPQVAQTCQLIPIKSETSNSSAPATTQPKPQRNVIREMQVRVPNRPDRRFSVMRFHSADHPDLSTGLEVFMQRENNLRQFRSLQNSSDLPDRGAGSEFGRELKEEARFKKFGVIRETYKPDDQPWIMTVGKGKTGRRRFRGVREGSVSDNVEYFVFCQCKDGNFDAYPVHSWYKMKPEINYRFLREDEAELEYSRLNKTMDLFNVMIRRKLMDGADHDDEETNASRDRELTKELRFLSTMSNPNK